MEYQSFGRYQNPKRSNIKHVLKLMIVLAVCAWLLYQIKYTETKNYSGQIMLVAGRGAKLFGRKGILSRLDERASSDSGMVQFREVQNGMQIRKNGKSEFSLKENEEDEDTGIKEKGNKMQKNVVESAANAVEETNEVQSFHDENGVPPDINEENISTFSKVNWLKKINIYEVVTYGEDNDVEMNLDGFDECCNNRRRN